MRGEKASKMLPVQAWEQNTEREKTQHPHRYSQLTTSTAYVQVF